MVELVNEFEALVAIVTGTILLFWKWDDAFSSEFREDVSLRLLCLEPPDKTTSMSVAFRRLFDAVFARKAPC
jgi:hypothetical protein